MAWVPETRTGLGYRYLVGKSMGTGIGYCWNNSDRPEHWS